MSYLPCVPVQISKYVFDGQNWPNCVAIRSWIDFVDDTCIEMIILTQHAQKNMYRDVLSIPEIISVQCMTEANPNLKGLEKNTTVLSMESRLV